MTSKDLPLIARNKMVSIASGPSELNLGFDHLRNRTMHFIFDTVGRVAFKLKGVFYKKPDDIGIDIAGVWTIYGELDDKLEFNTSCILRNFVDPEHFKKVYTAWKDNHFSFIAYYNPYLRKGLLLPLIAINGQLLTEINTIDGLPDGVFNNLLQNNGPEDAAELIRSQYSPLYDDDFVDNLIKHNNNQGLQNNFVATLVENSDIDTTDFINIMKFLRTKNKSLIKTLPIEFISWLNLSQKQRTELLLKCLEKMEGAIINMHGGINVTATKLKMLAALIKATYDFTREAVMVINRTEKLNDMQHMCDAFNSSHETIRFDLILKELGFDNWYLRYYDSPSHPKSISLVRKEHITSDFECDNVITV